MATKQKKPKVGRPRKPAAEKMSAAVLVKMTAAELAELRRRVGPGLSTWIRETVILEARRLDRSPLTTT
jgi:hypothetical protein